jgi:hypothetical protein
MHKSTRFDQVIPAIFFNLLFLGTYSLRWTTSKGFLRFTNPLIFLKYLFLNKKYKRFERRLQLTAYRLTQRASSPKKTPTTLSPKGNRLRGLLFWVLFFVNPPQSTQRANSKNANCHFLEDQKKGLNAGSESNCCAVLLIRSATFPKKKVIDPAVFFFGFNFF